MNFLQSPIWRHMQELVGRDIFEIKTQNQTYWGVTRKRGVGPLVFCRHQILGVSSDDIQEINDIIVQRFSSFGDVFTQLGVVSEVASFDLSERKALSADFVSQKKAPLLEPLLLAGWKQSWRENMPLATIRTLLSSQDLMLASYHKEHRRSIRKASDSGFSFQKAKNIDDWRVFYDLRFDVSQMKGIRIMSWDSFVSVVEFLSSTGLGDLFLLTIEGKIAAGSLIAYREGGMYYIYSAANRAYSSSGAHVYLQHRIMSLGHEEGFFFFDHRGVSPHGESGHHLHGVTHFKQRFGGNHIECLGNIDKVNNKILYYLQKRKA